MRNRALTEKVSLTSTFSKAVAALALAGCGGSRDSGFQGWVEADLIFVGPDEVGRVETLAVREGDGIAQGAPLFSVDPQLQEADLAMAQASLTNARQAFERAQALLKTAAGTQRTVDDAEAALRTAEARVASAQTRLTRRKVSSPVTGSVQQIYYRPGEVVSAGRPVVALLPPGNIKVRPDGSVKVLDFGLAKAGGADVEVTADSPTLLHAPTQVGVILGTAAYMAPEQVRGEAVDARTDVFAIGTAGPRW